MQPCTALNVYATCLLRNKHPPPPWLLHLCYCSLPSGTYPFPLRASIEGAYPGCPPSQCPGDRHVLAVDNYTCLLYEGYSCRAPSSLRGGLVTNTVICHPHRHKRFDWLSQCLGTACCRLLAQCAQTSKLLWHGDFCR